MAKSPLRGGVGGELSEEAKLELCSWPSWIVNDPESPFETEFGTWEERKRAWEAHGGELTEKWRREHPGKRPAAWWYFETDLPCGPSVTSGDIPTCKTLEEFRELYPDRWSVEAAWLDAHDLLANWEREELRGAGRA